MIEATNDPQKIGQALRWIVSLLKRYDIPYQICGRTAVKAYGATRPLVDIDMYASLQQSPHCLPPIRASTTIVMVVGKINPSISPHPHAFTSTP